MLGFELSRPMRLFRPHGGSNGRLKLDAEEAAFRFAALPGRERISLSVQPLLASRQAEKKTIARPHVRRELGNYLIELDNGVYPPSKALRAGEVSG